MHSLDFRAPGEEGQLGGPHALLQGFWVEAGLEKASAHSNWGFSGLAGWTAIAQAIIRMHS